jgi:Ca2+/Na+ antiporter
MPYIILGIGAALGLYGLYRFMVAASTRQIMAFFVIAIGVGILVGIFFMTITGRLLPAVGLLGALWPIFFSLYVHHKKKEEQEAKDEAEAAEAAAKEKTKKATKKTTKKKTKKSDKENHEEK